MRNPDHAAPHLVDVEVFGVIRREHLSGRLDRTLATQAIEDLEDWPGERVAHRLLLPRAWELRDTVSGPDAMYVALAEALDAVLVTTDRRLAAAPGPTCRIDVVDPRPAPPAVELHRTANRRDDRRGDADRRRPGVRAGQFLVRAPHRVAQRCVFGRCRSKLVPRRVEQLATAMDVVALDAAVAQVAAGLFAPTRHLGLSLADRACLALALSRGLPALTADRGWGDAAVGVDVRLIR